MEEGIELVKRSRTQKPGGQEGRGLEDVEACRSLLERDAAQKPGAGVVLEVIIPRSLV